MKRIHKIPLIVFLFFAICAWWGYAVQHAIKRAVRGIREIQETNIASSYELSIEKLDEWEMFRSALIEVESNGKVNAVGKSGDFGLYQLLPKGGYICEYNRLTKSNVTISDLKDNPELQHEIFNIVQAHHNPQKDIRKALKIHNPNAISDKYTTKYEALVMMNYYKLLNQTIYDQNK